MLKLDWCNILFKDEWLPDDELINVYGELMTKDEYMIETEGLNYFDKLQLLQPYFVDLDKDFVVKQTMSGKHYQNGLALGRDFYIHYDDECNNKGCFLEFPSQGLHRLYEWIQVDPAADDAFETLCKKLWKIGCRFSRVDICKDVNKVDNIFSPRYLCELYIQNRIVSRLRNKDLDMSAALPVQDLNNPDSRYIEAGSNGSTFYIGSLSNRRKILRVYDKEKETMNPDKPFYRWEVELHGNYARELQKKIIDGWTVSFYDLIRQFMYIIKENKNTTNRCLVEQDPEWLRFVELEFCEEIPSGVNLVPDRKDKDKNRREEWAISCIPSIASILWSCNKSENRRILAEICEDFNKFEYWCKDNDREDLWKEARYYLRQRMASGLL